jgi:tripartite-type tricarboxylate transporter receptor subunit TctC
VSAGLRRRSALAGGLAATLLPRGAPAWQPTRPVRIVVGYPPGGLTDILARHYGEALSREVGQPVVIENRPGAGGVIGAELVARAAPDGQTLGLVAAGNTVYASATRARMPFDPVADLTPVALIARMPQILVVSAGHPAATLGAFVDWVRAQPAAVPFASTGAGNGPHLTGELFARTARLRMEHVPYNGSAPAQTDVLAGHVPAMWDNLPGPLELVRAGRLRALAVSSEQRSEVLPEVPTLRESGLDNLSVDAWFGVVGPARMPAEAVLRANAVARNALGAGPLREALLRGGAMPGGGQPDAFGAFIREETARWRALVAEGGIPKLD